MPEKEVDVSLIIKGCQKKNRNSQRRLYELFYGYALNIALRYVQHREDAVEILNDSFFKAFKNLEQYNAHFSFKSWLHRIVVNTAIDHYRRHHHLPTVAEIDETDFLEMPDFPVISMQTDMLPILQQLSPQYRIVFNLNVMEGYSHTEIAEMLNISINTSRTNLMRAKQKLKELVLEQYEQKKGFIEYGRFFRSN